MKRLFLLLLLCASSAAAQDLRPSAYLGLPGKITVRGGKILGTSGGVTAIAEQTLTPANSATTYVYIDLSGTTALQTHGAGSLIAAPVIVAQGTITGVTNATTATVSIAATANCTGSATTLCWFAWGTQDDTAALAAAQTAAWNNGPCLTLQLPSGAAFVSAPGLGALGVGQGNACTG